MKPEEIEAARLIFVAMMKALSEHGTLLTGEFQMKLKQDFNTLIRQCDHMICDLEMRLNENQIKYIQDVTDVYHNINLEMRKEAIKKYQQLAEEENAA